MFGLNFFDGLTIVLGAIGAFFVLKYLHLWFLNPIKRDWELSKGRFILKVGIFTVSLPFVISAVILLLWGRAWQPTGTEDVESVFGAVLFQFLDPGLQGGFFRSYSFNAIVAILSVFFLNGLLISTLTSWFDKHKEQWLDGEVRYRKVADFGKHKFAVVIGANEVVSSVIKNLLTTNIPGHINNKCEANNDYVILQTCRNVREVRNELASHLTDEDLRKVVIYRALRDSKNELEKLYLEYCTEIYVLGESTLADGGETYHDAMNMRCVNQIAEILEKTRNHRAAAKLQNGIPVRRVCKVMFEYQTTYSILQFSDVSEKVNSNLVFIPFNRCESWARKVLVDCNSYADCSDYCRNEEYHILYTPLDGGGIPKESDEHVHFVIVGMSKMGVAMGVQAMLQAHYLNYAYAESLTEDVVRRAYRKNRTRTRITFIDTNADKEMDFFTGRYDTLFSLARHRYIDANDCSPAQLRFGSSYAWEDPMSEPDCKWKHLSLNGENFIDLEIEFIKGELESKGVRNYLECISDINDYDVKTSKLTFAVCLTKTHQAVAASLYMPLPVYEKAQEIWVYQCEAADIILNLTRAEQKDKRYRKLRPFGMLYGEYMCDRAQYLKALLVNGMYDLGDKEKHESWNMAVKETYSDLSQTWKMLTLDKKFSNRYFVDNIPLKMRSIGVDANLSEADEALFTDNCLARAEHNRWNVQQLLFGYSPCGKEIDDEFEKLNCNCSAPDAKDALNAWKQSVGWSEKKPAERLILKRDNLDYHKLPCGVFDCRKKEYKEGENRLHPNICDYAHLDKVDSGARGYDADLNKVIPVIGKLVKTDLKTQ